MSGGDGKRGRETERTEEGGKQRRKEGRMFIRDTWMTHDPRHAT